MITMGAILMLGAFLTLGTTMRWPVVTQDSHRGKARGFVLVAVVVFLAGTLMVGVSLKQVIMGA